MAEHIFTGFGFGPIQAGLFAKEAFESGNFTRIVVAEIDQKLVEAVRANKGSYYVNVAKADGIEVQKIDGVELVNPDVTADKGILLEVLAQSTEIVTCLPSVNFYDAGPVRNSLMSNNNDRKDKISNGASETSSVAALIADGLKNSQAKATIIYAAENHNHAAEILEKAVTKRIGTPLQKRVQFLNTVIGKMSRVVDNPAEIAELGLKAITQGIKRAFLVEEFNRILVTRTRIGGFRPGIEVFVEKDNLLPFEEAKLYGHNAIHSLFGFIGAVKGYTKMTELKHDSAIMQIGRDAFLRESGGALVKKYAKLKDKFFTEADYKNYAEDLLDRMTNPYLADTVDRVVRDAVRKLSPEERIFGTMQLAIEYGIEPKNMALGALAGVAILLEKAQEYNLPSDLRFGDWRRLDDSKLKKILSWVWNGRICEHAGQLIRYVQSEQEHLETLIEE